VQVEYTGEIIFEKSRKNLKKIYNRINNYSNIARVTGNEDVLIIAIGGYNRTFELLQAMGLKADDIATFSNLSLTTNFLLETHLKKVLYIRKINYVTSATNRNDYTKRGLDINVAHAFEESMLIYKTAKRMIRLNNKTMDWVKPSVIVLDDQSLNLQFGGHRFHYQSDIGFVQVRNRNALPATIIDEIKHVEEAEHMMFALYHNNGADEAEILDALNRLRVERQRELDNEWYMKPTEFKKVVGSNELVVAMREIKEIGIYQLKANKKIGKENARWMVIPEKAFEFKGFSYKDEDDLFNEQLENEMESENQFEKQQEELLHSIIFQEFPINMRLGYANGTMQHNASTTLSEFMDSVDDIETEQVNGLELLQGATTEQEYNNIKKYNLAYFLDGIYKDDYRTDDNYQGGKRIISIDIDDQPYTRDELENKLEMQGLFGLIYPTAKQYYDGSKRWRILLMADEEMTKEEYKNTVDGVAQMLELEIDNASKKISQLMGYPLSQKDISTVIGTMVNVKQFNQSKEKPKSYTPSENIISMTSHSTKTLLEFNHAQARLLSQAVTSGIPKGQRNDSYRQIVMFLRDVQANPELIKWHAEASDYENRLSSIMQGDGLDEKEVELLMR